MKERIFWRDTVIRRIHTQQEIRFVYYRACRIFRCLVRAKDYENDRWSTPALGGLDMTADGDVAVWAAYLSNRMPARGWVNYKRYEQWQKLMIQRYQRDPDIPF